jgi:hypothetical protein
MTDEETNKLEFYDKLTKLILDDGHTDADYSTTYGFVERIYEDGGFIVLHDEKEDVESRLSHIETKLEEILLELSRLNNERV